MTAFPSPLRRLLLLAAWASAMALAGCGKPAPKAEQEPLNFSILSAESQKSLGPLWQPLIDDLAKYVGRPVRPYFASNYTSLIEAMRFNQVQFGWFSALPALDATRRANGEVLGRFVRVDGLDSYKSLLIVRKGSGVTLDDVLKCGKKLSFGLGDAKSTSGTLAPMAYLFIPRGIDPTACFKAVRSASHESNMYSVAKGVLDVATNNSVGLIFAMREQPALASNVQVIWESPPLPESSIVARKDLDPAIKAKVTQFFLTYGTAPGPEGDRQRAVLRGLESSGFKPATPGYLDPVRQMEATSNLTEAKATGDKAKIAAAQKAFDEVAALVAKNAAASPADAKASAAPPGA
jgi:phosphonate transport system substrate-binding protein